MEIFIALITIVFTACITPGPNNFIVMNVAIKAGLKSAFLPIAGVLSGAVLLFLIAWFGTSYIQILLPRLHNFIAFIGAAYLTWLGASMLISVILNHVKNGGEANQFPRLPDTFLSVLLFQFLNAKSVLFLATLATETSKISTKCHAFFITIVILISVSGACLLIWAALGRLIASALSQKHVYDLFYTVMGILLFVPACFLLLNSFEKLM